MIKKILVLAFVVFMFQQKSYSQRNVYDKSKNRQLHSMVYRNYGKRYFRPRWYYWLFHNSYRSKDRRYIWQLLPTVATSKLNKNSTEDEGKEVDADYKDELVDAFDKTVNLKYNMLYEDMFDDLFFALYNLNLDADLQVLEEFKDNPFKRSEHYNNILKFQEVKKNIDDSYTPSNEKNSAYDVLIEDMMQYTKRVIEVKRLLKVTNKYAPLLQGTRLTPIRN